MSRDEIAGPQLWRVVKIFSHLSDNRRRIGSGYLVSAGRVLTAAHVVQDRRDLEIVLDNAGSVHRLTVDTRDVWVEPEIDLGIVPVDPDWVEERVPDFGGVAPTRFIRPPDRERVPARLCGFAAFKLREDATGLYRDSEDLDVEISRGSNMIEGILELEPRRGWEVDHTEPGESPWSSVSGTAVWVDGAIVGVVSQHRPNEAAGVLVAQPVARVLSLPTARRDAALDALGRAAADFDAPSADSSTTKHRSSDLAVVPIPTHADWGSVLGISGGRPAESLLTQLVLSRIPRMQIVVDPDDGELSDDLNRSERAYRRIRAQHVASGGRLLEIPRRRWYEVDLDAAPETRGDSIRRMLVDGGTWTHHAEPAFVLRTKYKAARAQMVDRAMGSLLSRVTTEYPNACVIVYVCARDAVAGVGRGRRLALRSLPSTPIYLRRRGEFRPSPARWAGIRTMFALVVMLEAAAVDAGQVPRLAHNPSSPPPLSSSLVDALKPIALARLLVEEIESTGIPATPLVEGTDIDEALLGALRDHAPRLYSAFLSAYAAHRTGSGWGVSMAFAAQSDLDFNTWLASAEGAGVYPDLRHPWPVRYGTAPYARLANMIRLGGVGNPERWRHPAVDKAKLVGIEEWSSSDLENADTWVQLSAQVPLLSAEAAMELVCRAEQAHPLVARVLGYAPITDEGLVKDRIDELRALLVPLERQWGSFDA